MSHEKQTPWRETRAAGWGQPKDGLHQNYNTNGRVDTIPVYRSDGRLVGEIRGDVLTKTAKKEHQLQRPAAWAWDAAILDAAENSGARYTEIHDDSGRIWRASLTDFRRHGIAFNRGYGRQIALPLSLWQVRKAGETAITQLALFGGAT